MNLGRMNLELIFSKEEPPACPYTIQQKNGFIIAFLLSMETKQKEKQEFIHHQCASTNKEVLLLFEK